MATAVTQVTSGGEEILVSGLAGSVSCTFTPAASSHTGLDSIGGAKTVTVSGAAGKFIKLTGYSLSLATTTPITTVYTAFLFGSTPTVIADDAAFVIAAADGALLLGKVSIAQPVDHTSTWQLAEGLIAGQPLGPLPSETVTVYLQNTSTVTTEAVAFKLTLFYEIQP